MAPRTVTVDHAGRLVGPYNRETDWVFASPTMKGKQNILQCHLRPAALRAGIGKIGWHTFRHSYSTMLRGAGADIKVQQELLRHSTIQSTMNTYTQAVSEQKRSANSMVVGILFNENASTDQPPANGS
ncbi:MAG: tyrosine-type recombinase/integrase [Candidatus Acidiferrum sp.]